VSDTFRTSALPGRGNNRLEKSKGETSMALKRIEPESVYGSRSASPVRQVKLSMLNPSSRAARLRPSPPHLQRDTSEIGVGRTGASKEDAVAVCSCKKLTTMCRSRGTEGTKGHRKGALSPEGKGPREAVLQGENAG